MTSPALYCPLQGGNVRSHISLQVSRPVPLPSDRRLLMTLRQDDPSFRIMDLSALPRSWFFMNPLQSSLSHLCTNTCVRWIMKRNTLVATARQRFSFYSTWVPVLQIWCGAALF